jgi:glycosyltransferase involved in cell wall biosynthesis
MNSGLPTIDAKRDAALAGGTSAERVRVLAFTEFFLPGFKGGGPIRTLSNMVGGTATDLEWRVVTRDRDLGELYAYEGVEPDRWQTLGFSKVFYASPRFIRQGGTMWLAHREHYDVLYLNSVFSRAFSILPLLARHLSRSVRPSVLVAPRGEFSRGVLALKTHRKALFLRMAKALRLFTNVHWHASTEQEAEDIRGWFGPSAQISVAPNPAVAASISDLPHRTKVPGQLRIAFLSRVARSKNLLRALQLLHEISGSVEFSIYGPLEDPTYVVECQREAKLLAPRIKVKFYGPVQNADVVPVLAAHDLFFLPTSGENFGHVILEALVAGCPVLVSDQTPWRNLAGQSAGWDLPLAETESFRRVLQLCVDMDEEEHRHWSQGARRAAATYLSKSDAIARTTGMFRRLARASASTVVG